jgi:uncharacterized membrane protein YgcG
MNRQQFRLLTLILAIVSLIVFVIIIALLGRARTAGNQYAVSPDYEVAPIVDNNSIIITTPKNGDQISVPIEIAGQAKGYWFNQGLFPVQIYDTERNLVATTYAIAMGDWTQPEAFVPFKAQIDSYDNAPQKKAGHIVFKKGNLVSGLADNEVLVVVEFGKKAVKQTTRTTGTTATTTTPACRDGRDNDGDGLIDNRDPGCHTDGNAGNPASFVGSRKSESDSQNVSSSTTSSTTTTTTNSNTNSGSGTASTTGNTNTSGSNSGSGTTGGSSNSGGGSPLCLYLDSNGNCAN